MPIDLSSINPTAVILGIMAFAVIVGAVAGSGGNRGQGGNNGQPQNNGSNNKSGAQPAKGFGAQKPFGKLFGGKTPANNTNQTPSAGIFGGGQTNSGQNHFQNPGGGNAVHPSNGGNQNPQNNPNGNVTNNNGMF